MTQVQSYPSGSLVDEGTPEFDLAVSAVRIGDREVLCNDDRLVRYLAETEELSDTGSTEFTIDNWENIYVDPDGWDVDQCREYLDDNLGMYTPMMDDTDEDEWREAVRDNAQPAEVLEWWRVTEWLCNELRSIGEVVISNEYGQWWGRTTSGQSYIMDGVLQQIAAKYA
jgi:hypothetical protein